MLKQPLIAILILINNSVAFEVGQRETGRSTRLQSGGTLGSCVHDPSNDGKDGLPDNVGCLPTVCWMDLPEIVGYPLSLSWHPNFGLL